MTRVKEVMHHARRARTDGGVELMRAADLCSRSALRGLTGHGLRTALSLVGVVIGVAAVVLLTALGEGARRYVSRPVRRARHEPADRHAGKDRDQRHGGVRRRAERSDAGGRPGHRPAPHAGDERVAPIAMGTEEVSYGERSRQVAIIGTTSEYKVIRHLKVAKGEFLPSGDFFRGSPVAVLGHEARPRTLSRHRATRRDRPRR